MPRSALALGPLTFVLAVACTACGSSGPSLATVSKQFLDVEASTNATLKTDTKLDNIGERNAAYAVAFAQAATKIRALQFPSYLAHDVDAVADDLDQMARQSTIVAADGSKDQNVLANVEAYSHADLKLLDEESSEKKASNALRRRVGLPIETTTTSPPAPLSTSPSPSP